MFNDNFWFHMLAALIVLFGVILLFIVFRKERTRYNLASLIGATIIFVGIVLSYVFDDPIISLLRKAHLGASARSLIFVLVVIALYAFFIFPNTRSKKSKNRSQSLN